MVEIQRDTEEGVLGVDLLVPRSSKNNGIQQHHHHYHTVFIDGISEDVSTTNGQRLQTEQTVEEEEEQVEEEGVNEISEAGGLFLGQTQGSETLNGSSRMEFHVVSTDHIVEDESTPKSSLETDLKNVEIRKDESTSIFSSATAKTSDGDHGMAVTGYSNVTIIPDESAVLEEAKQDSPDLDVERVVNEQETHDLFCPNCNSCITKRVILRRRKRKIQEISPAEEIVIPEAVPDSSPQQPDIVVEESVEDDSDRGGAFRCLSCFSIFIPIGRGFKLFPFGGGGLKETDRDTPQPATSDPPASVTGIGPGTVDEQLPGVVPVQEQSPLHSQPELLPEQGRTPTSLSPGGQEISMALPAEQTLPPEVEADGGNKLQQTKGDSMALPAEQTLPPEEEVGGRNKLLDANSFSRTGIAEDNKDTVDEHEGMQIVIDRAEPQAAVVPSTLYSQKDVVGIETVDPGNPVVVTVVSVTVPTDSSPETEPLLTPVADTSTIPATAAVAVDVTDDGDPQIDIIKCIIYGGLLESIASLSVVTSAAGASAKTLNIVALGAANMFGGLFILAHNLRVLKHETSDERYEEVLGRRGHFTLHSVVAVLSYLVFGLLPPLIYGFTFRESDNRDYKLIAVAAASLLCIIILAIGKSYIRTRPKAYMKTVMYYVGLWTMVCGVSYVAGELLELLLRKLGWFESSSSVAMTVGEFRPVKMPWASN